MVSCIGELFIWTLKNQTIISDNDLGCHTYHDKGETVSNADQPYYEEKMHYTESRDVSWTPKNRRPDKIRDMLKEAEDLLSTHRCVYCAWRRYNMFQVFLCNGTTITFITNPHSGDIDKMFIDKSLIGKFSTETLQNAFLTENFVVASVPEKARIDFIYFNKKTPSVESMKKFEKLSSFDPKLSQTDIPGPTGRRLERNLSCNVDGKLVLAWWPTASEEAWPWSPMTSDRERANLIILSGNGPKLEVLCFTRTECDPVHAQFSTIQPHQIFTIEQAPASGKEINVDLSLYEITRNKIHRVAVTSVPLKNGVITQGRNPTEDRVLLGCDNGTLVLYDENRRLTETVKSNLIPSIIAWHPSGTVVMVGSSRGEIQLYDLALNPILFYLVSEEPKPLSLLEFGVYFRSPPTLNKMLWCNHEPSTAVVTDNTDSLFLVFDRGPLAVLKFSLGSTGAGTLTSYQLVNQYIKHREIGAAVTLLNSLNWNVDGQECYNCLSAIATHLLRLSLNAERESQLEAALGSFYAPTRPLSEAVVLEFRDPISRFARRFFHHLLRYSRFDKAFLLAVDIGARDLFMDIHYLAQDKGEVALAEVAKKKAEQIDTESITDNGSDIYEDEDFTEESNEDSYYEEQSESDSGEVDRSPINGPPLHRQQTGQLNIPRQAFYQPQSSLPHIPPHNMAANDHSNYSYDEDPEISAQLMDEYSAAFGDQLSTQDSSQQEGDETSSSVKVIHFGMV